MKSKQRSPAVKAAITHIDVRSVRRDLGLTQQAFADTFGFTVGAVRDWEQGRKRPDRTARVLLAVFNPRRRRLPLLWQPLGKELPDAEKTLMDIVSRERRSAMMAGIGSRNTRPELAVRRAAHRLGLRFRLHRRDLPGSPDLVFPKRKTALFVHGFAEELAGRGSALDRAGQEAIDLVR